MVKDGKRTRENDKKPIKMVEVEKNDKNEKMIKRSDKYKKGPKTGPLMGG